jgi:L-ascorbate metabolism protein UlaG (beta-lactamase superfamily)
MKRFFIMVFSIIASIILLIALTVILFIKLSPQFGGETTATQQSEFLKSENYRDGKFVNKGDVNLDMSFGTVIKILKKYMSPSPNTIPHEDILVHQLDSLTIAKSHAEAKLFWFGHSTFLLEIGSKNILIDPMFGDVPAPHPMLGNSRFSKELPIEIERLPQIDVVLLSHDHYDHLDYGSIIKLKEKVEMFYVPLGLGAHLLAWGVSSEKIKELDWWQEIKHKELVFKCTPAQHFSGRGVSDKYGPFDFAMMECGQYNELWSDIHMFPEETVQAAVDVKAKRMMPIHWGAFKLALHEWTDPVERVLKKAAKLNVEIVVPQIGAEINMNKPILSPIEWWKM